MTIKTTSRGLSFFAPRYRIVTDDYAGYEVQRKLWWWPFWHMPETNTRGSAQDAEDWLKVWLASSPSGAVVKEIDTQSLP